MYCVITFDPLFTSKNFFNHSVDAHNHIKKVIDVSLNFFKGMRLSERKNYDYKRLEKMHELVKCIKFNDDLRNLFGQTVVIKPPITNEEYAFLCNKKNKARSVGKEYEYEPK